MGFDDVPAELVFGYCKKCEKFCISPSIIPAKKIPEKVLEKDEWFSWEVVSLCWLCSPSGPSDACLVNKNEMVHADGWQAKWFTQPDI